MEASGGSMTGFGGFHSLSSASILSTSLDGLLLSLRRFSSLSKKQNRLGSPDCSVRGLCAVICKTRVLASPCLTRALR